MARVRSLEEIERENGFMNNRAERARAIEVHAATRDDEVKHPPSRSSSLALDQRQREEASENERAIATVIARDIEQAGDNPDWESSSTTSITLLKTTPVSMPIWWVRFYDIPGADQLPNVLQYLCLVYADLLPEAKVIYQYPTTIGTTFFTRYVSQIQYRLEQAANDLLKEGKIDIALALVKANGREVLNMPTQGRDRFGTRIEGRTLLQMAGMAGDVNLREKKAEEKEDHGAVELLKQAAGLTEEEVANQLFSVLFSEEAKIINEARKNRILTVFIEFAENILKKKKDLPTTWSTIDEFKAAQARCQPEINKLRKDLLGIVSNQTITAGYILDSQLFVDLPQWFEKPENFKRFDGWWSLISDLFWVNGYGSLQYVAAARDEQVWRAGIGRVVDDKILPERSLITGGRSHFVPSSKLGVDFFLDYYAVLRPAAWALGPLAAGGAPGAGAARISYVKQKQKLCKIYAIPRQSGTNSVLHY